MHSSTAQQTQSASKLHNATTTEVRGRLRHWQWAAQEPGASPTDTTVVEKAGSMKSSTPAANSRGLTSSLGSCYCSAAVQVGHTLAGGLAAGTAVGSHPVAAGSLAVGTPAAGIALQKSSDAGQ